MFLMKLLKRWLGRDLRRKLAFAVILFIIGAVFFSISNYNKSGIYLVHQNSTDIRVNLILPAPTQQEGLAHYVEHLAWLSSINKDTRPKDRDANAWTSSVGIGYWLSGDPDDLPDMLKTLSGVFAPITVSRDFAEQERKIILREYDLELADNPDARAAEAMQAFLYRGNAIAASVLGTQEDIRMLSYDDAKAYHDATHLPERATLVVSGDVSWRELRQAIRKAGFPELSRSGRDIIPPSFILAAPETRTFTYPLPNVSSRMIWSKVVKLEESIQFDLLETQTALLTDILNSNLPGGLSGPLRFDNFIAKNFSVTVSPINEHHIEISFFSEPDKDVGSEKLQQAFETSMINLAKGIPQETYERIRKRFSSYWPDWEDEGQVTNWMADYVLDRVSNLRKPLTEEQLRKLDSQLVVSDINKLLTALIGPGRTAIAFIGKDNTR